MMEDVAKAKVENRAIAVGALGNLIMALAAWVTFYLSNSEAILLDGNYSFIIFLGMMVALRIAGIKSRRTEVFPLGQFFYEALYGFIKGLMMLGVILMAVVTSVVRIIFYSIGETENIPMLNPQPILVYAVAMAIICFALSAMFKIQNKRINNQSIILFTDQKAAFVDGVMSAGIAAGVFFLVRAVESGGPTGWIPYLADAVFTLVLSSMLIKEPVAIIKNSVIELAGGVLQDKEAGRIFEQTIRDAVPNTFRIVHVYLSKTGSRYMAVVYLYPCEPSGVVSVTDLGKIKEHIRSVLAPNYPHVHLELIIQEESE